MRRLPLYFLLALLVLMVAPAYAIPAEFTAWLYTPDTGTMTLVDLSGEVDSFELPLAPPYDVRPFTNVVVSPNGNTIAYVLGQSGSFNQQLMVYSYSSRAIIAQYPVTNVAYTSIDFGGRFAFSPDSNLVAFGYSKDPAGWEMVVIDLTSFSIAGSISSLDPALSGVEANFGITPMPTYFISSNSLAFALIRGGTEASEPAASFVWDLVTNGVTPNVGYGSASDVFRPTGEAVMTLTDTRFGSTPDAFMFGQQNTLQVYDSTAAARWPVYANAAWSMYMARFVFNGRQVAFVAYDGTAERAYILNRDGSLAGSLPVGVVPYDIAGVPDGFIYAKQDGGIPGLYSINLRAGDTNGSLVWSGVPNTYPRIAWVGALGSADFMFVDPPYAAWAELAERVADSEGSSGSSETAGILRIGATATVFTTEGDSLRVRSGPGTSFVVLREIDPGTVVTLVDGPTSAGGFVWWNIRLADGTTGWVVEFADGEQTLIPVSGGGAATPVVSAATATPGADPSVPSQLRVGDNAFITTNSLRLRSVPGFAGAVLREMTRNTFVRIIGGPTRADNFDWWQLRLLDGTQGWAAEVVGTERVITFTTSPAPTSTPLVLVLIPTPTPLIFVILTPAVPVQTSPADGAVFNIFPRTTTLMWNAASGASSYEVRRQWCDGSGNNCNNYTDVTTAATSYTFDFIGAQVGRWRVRSVSAGGVKSDWSPWRTFRHQQ
ncbi:MAG: SH3 domain-containing protein [Chloroflexi bacterium]|nr:SH3 domain-containing protein [Chloroflexota bacterium]